jgi:signal transduction histidine kinase
MQPRPIQSVPQSEPETGNAVLPASILLGSLILAFFLPVMLVAAFGALAWILLVARHRLRIIERTRARLEQSERHAARAQSDANHLASILGASDLPILATDQNAVITHSNHAAHEILGGGRPLRGITLDELITHKPVLDLAKHAIAGESGHARFTLPILGQTHEMDVAADPLSSGNGCVFTFRDITELTKAVALKADFAANASHELRTPIASIRGAVDTLMNENAPPEAMRRRMTEMISNNATRLELLVNDLLDLSKLESTDAPPAIVEINLHELIESIAEQFAPICTRRSITIEPSIDGSVRTIRSDRSLLGLILRNLIENATKFAREETSVRVGARPSELGLIIEVADKGVGIPIGDQQRIFERFYQVDDARSGTSVKRGTGLGLAIVKHACRRLGGSIAVRSVYGQGTTMSVTLPNPRSSDQDPS